MSLVTEYKNEQTSPDQSFFRAALYSCTTSNSGNRDAIAQMLEDDDKVRKISTEYWNEGFENLAHDRGAHLLKRMLELRSDDITPTAINAAVKEQLPMPRRNLWRLFCNQKELMILFPAQCQLALFSRL